MNDWIFFSSLVLSNVRIWKSLLKKLFATKYVTKILLHYHFKILITLVTFSNAFFYLCFNHNEFDLFCFFFLFSLLDRKIKINSHSNSFFFYIFKNWAKIFISSTPFTFPSAFFCTYSFKKSWLTNVFSNAILFITSFTHSVEQIWSSC